jgi:hypothetical protein
VFLYAENAQSVRFIPAAPAAFGDYSTTRSPTETQKSPVAPLLGVAASAIAFLYVFLRDK